MRKTRQQQVREIREAALEHARKGSHAVALARFSELEQLEPAEADWPRRAAECQRALGDVPRQIRALGRAAELYARSDSMAKAIAMCRMILALDPKHTETQVRLAALQKQGAAVASLPRANVAPAARAPEKSPAAAAAPEASASAPVPEATRPRPELGRLLRQRYVERARSGATRPANLVSEPALPFLPEVSLNELLPGSKPIRGPRGIPSGMHRLELGEIRPQKPVDRALEAAQKALPATPLFSELDPKSLERLIARARLEHFEPGAAVYRQNDAAETLHVIVNGTIVVLAEQEERIEITRLTEGEFFGEAALMSGEPRLTTAEALEATDVLTIDRETIRELVAEEPRLLSTVLRFLRERLIESSMLTNPLFTILSGIERRRLAMHFEFVEIEPGSLVIWQGVRSPGLFVLLSGAAEVIYDDGDAEHLFSTLRPGAVFGEMSLLDEGAAVADVRFETRSYALLLPKADFPGVASDYPSVVEFIRLLAESRRRKNALLLGTLAD